MNQNDSSGSLIKPWPVLLDHYTMYMEISPLMNIVFTPFIYYERHAESNGVHIDLSDYFNFFLFTGAFLAVVGLFVYFIHRDKAKQKHSQCTTC